MNNSTNDHREIAAIHDFWFGLPARDPAQLLAKFARWYQGGADVDRAIAARFASTVERALSGALHDWAAEPQGQLALILLLDQFARNLFRDTPRAYAGDAMALQLALRLVDSPAYLELPLEQRLFCIMPLVHSESLAVQTQALQLARALAADAPSELAAPWRFGAERTAHYGEIIARFGRFPHRNAILGRAATPEELAFLEAEATRPSPLAAAGAQVAPVS
jgi:uncharacterized protein (DUF924 family)